jgi:hypothetical protein
MKAVRPPLALRHTWFTVLVSITAGNVDTGKSIRSKNQASFLGGMIIVPAMVIHTSTPGAFSTQRQDKQNYCQDEVKHGVLLLHLDTKWVITLAAGAVRAQHSV